MKRINNLYPQVCAFPSLWYAARKARRGNRHSEEANEFWFFLEKGILQLQEELESYTYLPGAYHYFRIQDPKERTISVAPFRDRVVHHAIVGVLEPIYERSFIAGSYACRKGKGTHRAIFEAQRALHANHWFFKTDIEQFFDSVDHGILLHLLKRKIKDRPLLELISRILENGGSDGKGLPIGNLTSQFFANVYLSSFDHFVKQTLRVENYIRYMDDFVLFSNDKQRLLKCRNEIVDFLEVKLQLQLKPSATFFNQKTNGLSFLGTRIFPSMIRIRTDSARRSFKRLKRRQHEFANGRIDFESLSQSTNSILSHMAVFDTLALRQAFFKGYSRKGL